MRPNVDLRHSIQIREVAAMQQNPFDATPPLKYFIQTTTQLRSLYIQRASPAGRFLSCACRSEQYPDAVQYERIVQ